MIRLCPNLVELGIVQVSRVLKSSDVLRTHSYPMQPYGFHVARCISAAQGFVKLRLLEVVLPCRLGSYCPDPRPVWESRMEEHVIAVLGNIRGHTKSLKIP